MGKDRNRCHCHLGGVSPEAFELLQFEAKPKLRFPVRHLWDALLAPIYEVFCSPVRTAPEPDEGASLMGTGQINHHPTTPEISVLFGERSVVGDC